jgi:hypothetical protein
MGYYYAGRDVAFKRNSNEAKFHMVRFGREALCGKKIHYQVKTRQGSLPDAIICQECINVLEKERANGS